jgi:hypothetical protein
LLGKLDPRGLAHGLHSFRDVEKGGWVDADKALVDLRAGVACRVLSLHRCLRPQSIASP